MNPRKFITDILEAIGYEEDKEKFASDFVSLCFQQALVDLMADLPPEAQAGLVQKLANNIDPEMLNKTLQEYFPKQTYEDAVKFASQEIFSEYIDTISPSLSEEQKKKLEEILSQPSQV